MPPTLNAGCETGLQEHGDDVVRGDFKVFDQAKGPDLPEEMEYDAEPVDRDAMMDEEVRREARRFRVRFGRGWRGG